MRGVQYNLSVLEEKLNRQGSQRTVITPRRSSSPWLRVHRQSLRILVLIPDCHGIASALPRCCKMPPPFVACDTAGWGGRAKGALAEKRNPLKPSPDEAAVEARRYFLGPSGGFRGFTFHPLPIKFSTENPFNALTCIFFFSSP